MTTISLDVREPAPVAPGSTYAGAHPETGAMMVHVVGMPALAPPTGATITGDAAAHALGALTGAGRVVVAAVGGTVTIGSATSLPTSTTGFPVLSGASYDWQAADVAAVRVYVPAGASCVWGVHQ